nr:hypothetical protein [Actinoplanes awajinensis]
MVRLGEHVEPQRRTGLEATRLQRGGLCRAVHGGEDLVLAEHRHTEQVGDRLSGGQPQPVATQQVAHRQPGRVHRRLGRTGEGVQVVEGLVVDAGDVGVELAGVRHVRPGADHVLPLDDPVVRDRVEVVEVATERGEREQQLQARRDPAVQVEVQVEVVRGPDHRVAEPVPGERELQRHPERVGGRVEPVVAAGHDVVDDSRLGDPLEEVVHHDVLVVLAQHPARLAERQPLADQLVVRLEERDVQLTDDQVLVVARVAGQRRPVVLDVVAAGLARQVVVVALARRALDRRLRATERADVPDQHLRAVARRRRPVDAVQVERAGPQVAHDVPDLGHRQRRHARVEQIGECPGAGLQGDVVIDELPEVRVRRRDRAVPGRHVGLGHRRAELLQQLGHVRRLRQQVRLVVLQRGEQVVEAVRVQRWGERESGRRAGTELRDVAGGPVQLLLGDDPSVQQAWHGFPFPVTAGALGA